MLSAVPDKLPTKFENYSLFWIDILLVFSASLMAFERQR